MSDQAEEFKNVCLRSRPSSSGLGHSVYHNGYVWMFLIFGTIISLEVTEVTAFLANCIGEALL